MQKRLARGRGFARLSLAVNAGLALIKFVTGVVGNSSALVADAVESLGDLLSSTIVWGGLVIAARPADENHPYGHGKAEPLAALAVAALLLVAGATIAYKAIRDIQTPQEPPALYTLPVLLAVIVVKEWMYRIGRRTGLQIDSAAIRTDAWHHRSDALTSAAAFGGITIALIGGPGYEAADEWAALAACGIIVTNGVRFVRVAVAELMDTMHHPDLAGAIADSARAIPEALDVEKVLIRKMGPHFYVDLHVEVDPQMPVRQAHQIAHAVKDKIMTDLPNVADVLVHVEPHGPTQGGEQQIQNRE